MNAVVGDAFSARLNIGRPDGNLRAWLTLLQAELPQLEAVMRDSDFLHAQELDYYEQLTVNARRASFLAGRWCAKNALVAACDGLYPADRILVQSGVLQHPVVREGPRATQVSISHANGVAAAVAFDESHPMGIDIERPSEQVFNVMSCRVMPNERLLLERVGLQDDSLGCTWLWTAKEAVAKAMKIGLTVELDLYEMESAQREGALIVTRFRHFSQFKCLSFVWHDFVVSVALPWKSRIDVAWMDHLDISSLAKHQSKMSMHSSPSSRHAETSLSRG